MYVVVVDGVPDWRSPYEVAALEVAWVLRARGYHVEVEEE